MGKKKPKTKIEQIDLKTFKKKLTSEQIDKLLKTLKARFEENENRHSGLKWSDIKTKLETMPEKLQSLNAMEVTGGEPDVIGYDPKNAEYIFCDCSPESPNGRRSICYDGEGQEAREKKGIYPAGNAIDMAEAMGIEILTEAEYRNLQEFL